MSSFVGCGFLPRDPIPVDSRRFPSTRHWGGSARRGRASGAACERGRVREETNRQESTGIDRSRVCPCGAKRTRATAQGRERVDSGAARREGPRTNGKSKCGETRPMGAGRRQIESVTLCVWQCHLRNISTLSNRTQLRRQGVDYLADDGVYCPRRLQGGVFHTRAGRPKPPRKATVNHFLKS